MPGWQRNYLALLAQRDLPAWGLPSKPQMTERLFKMLAVAHGTPCAPELSDQVGKRGAKYEAAPLTLGERDYIDDIRVPGMLHAALRLTDHARADVTAIDTAAAAAADGVVAVFTAADIPGEHRVGLIHKDWPVMIPVGGRTSCAGDVLAVVVAETRDAARAAVELVDVGYDVHQPVTDPVAAQLVPSMAASGTNVTGVSDALELDRQVELIGKVVPGAKRVGMVYNPGEANSVVVVERLRELLPKSGMSLVEAAAPRTVDVGSAARSLIGKVDVIYTNTDNNVVSAYEALVKVGNDAKIPLVAADTDSVKRGAIAALGVDYRALGQQTGEIVVRILNGEKPGDIPSETSAKLELYVNPGAAKRQGVALSEEFVKSAAQVVE